MAESQQPTIPVPLSAGNAMLTQPVVIPTLAPMHLPEGPLQLQQQQQFQNTPILAPNQIPLGPSTNHVASVLNASLPQYQIPPTIQTGASKYSQLLSMIDELGKDIRPTYNGNRNCSDRLKRSIQHARGLVRECMADLEKNVRQQQQATQNNSL